MYNEKMKQLFLTLCILPLILLACTRPGNLVIQPTEQELVITPLQTMPTPISESSLTPTQSVVISSQPFLLYYAYDSDRSIIAVGMDGQTRSSFQLPPDSCIKNWNQAISPNGHWLAFYIGCETSGKSTGLSLNLLHLPDGVVHQIANFLIPLSESNAPDTFILDWSNDGRYLAFAGAKDTSSVELYLFDMNMQTVQRLTDGLKSIEFLDWSPDGKWLWFRNSVLEGSASRVYFYAIQPFTNSLQTPSALFNDRWVLMEGWFAPNLYFLANSSEGCCGPNNLRYIDIETGHEKKLWASWAMGYAIDRERGIVIVSSALESDIQGTYFVDLEGNTRKITDKSIGSLAF